mmetsp:Transcript_11406/g.20495  ORF Transcript_11406/g.20495 Transcript_11406/m.20495 type:complete len:136 (-) Transcript_11406:334-741(-)
MRLRTSTSFISLAMLPASTSASAHGAHLGRLVTTQNSASLAARRVTFPVLRRTDLLYPDIDCISEEVDEIIESFLQTTRLSRPGNATEDRKQRRPLACNAKNRNRRTKTGETKPRFCLNDKVGETEQTVDFPYWL